MNSTATVIISINDSKLGGETAAVSRAILDETTNVCRLLLSTQVGIDVSLVTEAAHGEDSSGSPLVVIISAFDSIDWYYDEKARYSANDDERLQRVRTIGSNIKGALQSYLQDEHHLEWEPKTRIVLLQGAEV